MVKVILDWCGWRKEMDIDNRYAVMGQIDLPVPRREKLLSSKDAAELSVSAEDIITFRYRGRKIGIKPIFKADV